MKRSARVLLLSGLLLPSLSWSQADVVGAVVGSVTGTVQDAAGELVAPEGAIQATITASDSGGTLTATINGTAATAGALGMVINFSAEFEPATAAFAGLYTDKPGGTPDQAIIFTPAGGLSWVAAVSGVAPSSTGERSYDLNLQFNIPEAAIFPGNQLPGENVFNGTLAHSAAVSVPLVVPEIGLNQLLDFDFSFAGDWTATSVPQDDGSSAITGYVSGTFDGTAADLTVTVPLLGTMTLPVSFNGTFAGNLFVVSPTELAFRGSWTAASLDQVYGGDATITIPLTNSSSFPFELEGTMPMPTGILFQPVFALPFSVTGSFPLVLGTP